MQLPSTEAAQGTAWTEGQPPRAASLLWCVRAQVCRVAQGALRSDRKEQKLQETAERRRAGDKLAVPDPIYLIGRRWGGWAVLGLTGQQRLKCQALTCVVGAWCMQ